MTTLPLEDLRTALHDAGVPDDFSVLPVVQMIPRARMQEIDELVAIFDRVTTRPRWQQAVTADAPGWARTPRSEVCFFSAWDVHLPHDDPAGWRLIECNDNGSGFVFASLVNDAFYKLADLGADPAIEAPLDRAAFGAHVAGMLEREATAFFGARPAGLLLVLDDADSLSRGHFRVEHELLAAVARAHGWDVAIGAPEELAESDGMLTFGDRAVRFVVNRSTDFLWQGDAFDALRRCFASRSVYVAPNPFSYLTRSDKRLFELLSQPDHDDELGITREERAVLDARVPPTWLLRADNVDALAARKHELFFKPARGYASHGTIAGANVGRSRLRRLLRDGDPYVAQRFVARGQLELPGDTAGPLYTDLRVWAYRGARYLVSGRASRSSERNELRGGGWLPTFVRAVAG